MSNPRVEVQSSQSGSTPRPRDPWVRFACPRCGKRNKADALLGGSQAACARCGEVMRVPATPPRVPATPPRVPVMRSIEPPAIEGSSNWLGQLSNHVAERSERPTSPEVDAPRASFRLPTWVMVVLHASLTLGTIAAIWLLHNRGYFAGFTSR